MTSPSSTRAESLAGPSHREILTILGGLMLGMFLAALDQTIVATSIRTIGDDLHGLSLQAWVTTAYLLTSTLSTPVYGKLSDQYGRKPFYLLAIGLFVVGSMLSGTSTSMYELAAYRAVQGLGAGGLMSLAITILGDLVAPRERARYQAYFLSVFGVASVLGPVIGGFFAGQSQILAIAGWRWVFLVNVPLGVLGFFVIVRVLHLPALRRVAHRIDWPGALALVVGLVPLLIVAEQGREWGWASTRSIGAYVTGLVGLVAFVALERRAGYEAILPLGLFREKVFSLGAGANAIIGLGMFGGIAVLPLYLQIVQGMSPTKAGLALIPFTIGIMAASVASGQFTMRTGRYKIFPVIGAAAMAAGAFLFATLNADTTYWTVAAYSLVFGLGLGFTMQPLVLAVQNAVPVKDMGVATSSSLFFRQMGGTLGTAVFLSILFSTVGDNIAAAFRRVAPTHQFREALRDPAVVSDPANAPVLSMLRGGSSGAVPSLDDSAFISRLDPRLAHPFEVGFSQSVDLVMLVAGVVLIAGIVLVAFIPELPLRNVSGIEGRAAEEAAAQNGPSQAPVAGAPAAAEGAALESPAADGAAGEEAAEGGPHGVPGGTGRIDAVSSAAPDPAG